MEPAALPAFGDSASLRLLLWTIGTAGVAFTLCGCSDMPKCTGPVQQNLRFGCATDISLANRICCRNADFAEYSGYFQQVGGSGGLFAQLDATGTTTFYDTVCGLPLFKAPVGRSFAAWRHESKEHGWPSFRSSEIVSNNIIFKEGGEIRSVCGTHLGHNIPDMSGDRYCIDLVCIAGQQNVTKPLAVNPSVIHQ
eukprot:TRINITY_DN114970_c0_g1_i1.p1 TRINITY_DN114970_c0_g1~~TRINITY_DN114970_c0_g1_i1.p1  ORF type:complete len:202 (-),score=18.30 TRINITY_DN114970_c0_g1_i1:77-661(-)